MILFILIFVYPAIRIGQGIFSVQARWLHCCCEP